VNEYRCDHDPAGVCWLCSDQVSWWRELRIRRGLPAEPRQRRRRGWVEYMSKRAS
jgi:hypothetical protein